MRSRTAPHGDRTQLTQGCGKASLRSLDRERSDRSLRRSSGSTPLLSVPLLANASAEAIDGRTLRFLFKKNLALKKKRGGRGEEESGDGAGEEEGRGGLRSWRSSSWLNSRVLLVPPDEEDEEVEASSILLSSWLAAPGCLRQGYWFLLRVFVMLVWRLRQASSPCLRGSSGGHSRLRVRYCRVLERRYWCPV